MAEEKTFRSAIDLVMAEKWLDKIDAVRRLFVERMPFDLPADADVELAGWYPGEVTELTLAQLFLTALANRVLGREFLLEPIPVEELPTLHAAICCDGKLDESLCEESIAWVDSLVAGSGAIVSTYFDLLREGFCSIDPDGLDPRFISGLIVRVE